LPQPGQEIYFVTIIARVRICMKPRRIIYQLRRNVRDHGWRVTLPRAIKLLFRHWYETREYRIYRIDLRRYHQPPPLSGSRWTFRFLTKADTAAIKQIEQMEDSLAGWMHSRLSNGSICLAAFDGEQVAGFNLISFGQIRVPTIHWTHTFRSDCGWGEQITIAPHYRRRRIALELRHRILTELKCRGITRLYGGAFAFNHPSLNLARKAGFTEIATMLYRKRFNSSELRCCRMKPPT
jgi:RimJ/RimL family protein N-acetyltransferase